MAELARGTIGDRPWGRTLAALSKRGLTGQVSIICDGKLYQIGFDQGAIVGAVSPLASDAAARVALTLHLVSSTQVVELSRRTAANPRRDEIDIIAEYARIPSDQAMRLRRRTIATRAARTFAIDHGDFVVEDHVDAIVMPGSEIDVRGIIYMGAVQHITDDRLVAELAKLGTWFQIRPDAVADLPQFGFTDNERPILEALLAGTSLGALEKGGQDLRTVRAVVYALASSGVCVTEAHAQTQQVPQVRAAAPHPQAVSPQTSRIVTQPSRLAGQPQPAQPVQPQQLPQASPPRAQPSRLVSQQPPVATPMPDTFTVARTNARAGMESVEMPTLRRVFEPGTTLKLADAPTNRRVAAPSATTAETSRLIQERLKLIEAHADHFALLGVDHKATDEQVRKAYFQLARQLHPDRLASLGMTDDSRNGQRLFAQVNAAFGILSDPQRRAEYVSILSRGGEAAIRAEQAQAEATAMKVLEAEEAYARGERALKRDAIPLAIAELTKAVALNPDEPDYQSLLVWAQFCGAPDKMGLAPAIKGKLAKQIQKNSQAVLPRFYLARVERMLGRDAEALKVFESILRIDPDHADTITEIRVLRGRLR